MAGLFIIERYILCIKNIKHVERYFTRGISRNSFDNDDQSKRKTIHRPHGYFTKEIDSVIGELKA